MDVRSQAGNIRVYFLIIQKDYTARYSAGDLKIYAFCWKIQQGASGPGQSAAGFKYLSLRIQPES